MSNQTHETTTLQPIQRRRCRNSPNWFTFGIVSFLTAHLLITTFVSPAYAQFYREAEGFFVQAFPDAGTAIPIIFNILRALLVIYLGVALIQGVNAVQRGEDVIVVARTPVIVIVVVTVGNFLVNIIIA